MLRAADTNISPSARAVRRTHAASDVMEILFALRIIDESVLFTVALTVVLLTSYIRRVIVESLISEFPGVSGPASIRAGFSTEGAVISESTGADIITNTASIIMIARLTLRVVDKPPLLTAQLNIVRLTSLLRILETERV